MDITKDVRLAIYYLMLERFEDACHPCSCLCSVLSNVVDQYFIGFQKNLIFYDEIWDQRTTEEFAKPWFAYYDAESRINVLKNAIKTIEDDLKSS